MARKGSRHRSGSEPGPLGLLVQRAAVERIADHCAIVAARLQYLLTGDPGHLASEVR